MSLMKTYLTQEILAKYKNKRTNSGGSLDQCIKSGLLMPESKIGIYATDPDSYNCFAELFYPIIHDAHDLSSDIGNNCQPTLYFGEDRLSELDLSGFDPDGLIISTRVRVARNLANFPLSVAISKKVRLMVERRIENGLMKLPSHLKGTYRRLGEIPEDERMALVKDHILYNGNDMFLQSAGIYRDWPSGRGLFRTNSDNIHVWVNEEDQIRIISMATGAELNVVYSNLIQAVLSLEKNLDFARDFKLGYVTVCPTNLGTALRASVHIRLRKVSTLLKFKDLCAELGLDIRGTDGENTSALDAVYDISNRRRLGLTEFDAVKQMACGVRVLLLLERSL